MCPASLSVESTDKEADRQHVVFYWVEDDRSLTFVKDYLNI